LNRTNTTTTTTSLFKVVHVVVSLMTQTKKEGSKKGGVRTTLSLVVYGEVGRKNDLLFSAFYV